MSFLSGLRVFGQDIEKVLGFGATTTGKAIIDTGEAVLETLVPASAPLVTLFNGWYSKAVTVESLAVAAGKGTGSGVEKAALVDAAIAPTVLAYAQQVGLAPRTAEQIAAANNALIAFVNAMTQDAPAA